MASTALAEEVTARLGVALEGNEATAIDSEIENVLDLTVGALIHDQPEIVMALHSQVERLYAKCRASAQRAAGQPFAGQLRTLTSLLSTASRRRRAPDASRFLNDAKYAPLLMALRDAGRPLNNQALAAEAGLSEETVARNMPALRAAGLVRSVSSWKQKLNTLTATAESAMGERQALDGAKEVVRRTQPSGPLSLAAEIVASHVSNNAVPIGELPQLIRAVYNSLSGQEHDGQKEFVDNRTPAVPIKKSVMPEYIVCLEDGKKLKMLKRHLKTCYNMTAQQYRERWGLPDDYPMVAPAYAEQRSSLAKKIGLGSKPRASGAHRRA